MVCLADIMFKIDFYDYEGIVHRRHYYWMKENCGFGWYFSDFSVKLNGVMYYENTDAFREEYKKFKMWEKLSET